MYYAIFGTDSKDSLARRGAVREAHLANVATLVEEGRVLLAGPHPAIDAEDPGDAGFSGSLIVAEFESLEAARAWAEADPYTREGVFSKIEVKPFKRVLP